MTQINRIDGGLVDRTRTLNFRFDGRACTGHPGDTLASALLANGIRLMGRSFKYHRPRGPLSAGPEEPNALVELRRGPRREPNTRATEAELFEGLAARSQNRWPLLAFDVMAVNDLLAPVLAAGFYYKTFMWPKSFWERLYEPAIRNAAGLGRLDGAPDPDLYDRGFLHCDLLIIGGGPAGLAAALTAGRSGADVILADSDFVTGGRLNAETHALGDAAGADWARNVCDELEALPNVRLMRRTTVFGAYDHGTFGALERNTDHLPVAPEGKPRQTYWRIRTPLSLLCAGATERPIAFERNDRPGIMLAGALRAYANRWAAVPARRIAVFTNNDDGHRAASDLLARGIEVSAVIDCRPDAPRIAACDLIAGGQVIETRGRLGLTGVSVRTALGGRRALECGALGVSGGWNPNVHLTCHQGGRPRWNDDLAAFVPGDCPPGMRVAGAANGLMSTAGALSSGARMAVEALGDLGRTAAAIEIPQAEDAPVSLSAFWHVGEARRAWIDQQNDVTVKDVKLAHQEGYRSVEHLKRYTTLGMATDQGRTANVIGLAVMAELTGRPIPETGTTIFRPPFTPVPVAALAGRATGRNFRPVRRTPGHGWATENGAVFTESGLWLRAQWFPRPDETHWRQSVDREVLATRASVGICDVSTLGKIDVQGSDAADFLDRVYANRIATLAAGRVRYGLMLREDGIVMDDGTVARLAPDRFLVTTTTARAEMVFRHLEFCRQCLWPDLDVQLVPVTEGWAQYSVAGPNARRLLQKIVDAEHDLSNAGFPYMACADLTICGGQPARLFRISFSGELGFEIAVSARFGDALIRRLMTAGEDFDAVAYGLEALNVMRIEKGHVTGNDLNGTTTALELGMGRMVSSGKDAIGTVLSQREALIGDDVLNLVGFRPVDPAATFAAGAHLIAGNRATTAANDEGYLTSVAYSPALGHTIGLGFLRRGTARIGETLRAVNPLEHTETSVEVTSPHFIDPQGERLLG